MAWLRKLLGLELGESRAVEVLTEKVNDQRKIIEELQAEKIKELLSASSTKMELSIYRRRAEELRKAWPEIYRKFFTTEGIASRTGKAQSKPQKGSQ